METVIVSFGEKLFLLWWPCTPSFFWGLLRQEAVSHLSRNTRHYIMHSRWLLFQLMNVTKSYHKQVTLKSSWGVVGHLVMFFLLYTQDKPGHVSRPKCGIFITSRTVFKCFLIVLWILFKWTSLSIWRQHLQHLCYFKTLCVLTQQIARSYNYQLFFFSLFSDWTISVRPGSPSRDSRGLWPPGCIIPKQFSCMATVYGLPPPHRKHREGKGGCRESA